jgi:hypothetical protein
MVEDALNAILVHLMMWMFSCIHLDKLVPPAMRVMLMVEGQGGATAFVRHLLGARFSLTYVRP